jgi:hypothetical protein
MIRVILQGGLGNQMFEYAAAYALSQRNNVPFSLDMSYMDVFGHKSWCRPYELSVFALHNAATFTHDKRLAVRILPRLRAWCSKKGILTLGRYVFDVEQLDQAPNCKSLILFDYFANAHLFESYREKLLQAFTFAQKPNEANAILLKEIASTNAVAVHIRRGDYLNNANANVFYHPTVEWYRRAMGQIEQQVKAPHYYFFSDDSAWMKEQFADIPNATFVDINHGRDAYNDMRLMSACKHNIIANSTFSWWAAWLNSNPQKIVIAPARYYMNEEGNRNYLSRMIPDNWITME